MSALRDAGFEARLAQHDLVVATVRDLLRETPSLDGGELVIRVAARLAGEDDEAAFAFDPATVWAVSDAILASYAGLRR